MRIQHEACRLLFQVPKNDRVVERAGQHLATVAGDRDPFYEAAVASELSPRRGSREQQQQDGKGGARQRPEPWSALQRAG